MCAPGLEPVKFDVAECECAGMFGTASVTVDAPPISFSVPDCPPYTKRPRRSGVPLVPSHRSQPVGMATARPDHVVMMPVATMPPSLHAPAKNGDIDVGVIWPTKSMLHVQPDGTSVPALLAGHATAKGQQWW